jgi:hypothetical protein
MVACNYCQACAITAESQITDLIFEPLQCSFDGILDCGFQRSHDNRDSEGNGRLEPSVPDLQAVWILSWGVFVLGNGPSAICSYSISP